jgi:hypothetical protein
MGFGCVLTAELGGLGVAINFSLSSSEGWPSAVNIDGTHLSSLFRFFHRI